MKSWIAAFWAEWMKVRRSKVTLLIWVAISMLPLIGGFFMILLKAPEAAANAGIVGQKAQMLSGEASWPAYFSILSQGIALGGLIIFGFLISWIFGREHADRTLKDILALPTPRSSIVLAKYSVFCLAALAMSASVYAEGLLVGSAIGLAGWSVPFWKSISTVYFTSAFLTVLLCTPVAFFAHWGRGYLSALGFVIFSMVMAQVVGAAGYGAWFPWSIPALHSGMAGPGGPDLTAWSFVLVLLTSAAGVGITLVRWQRGGP